MSFSGRETAFSSHAVANDGFFPDIVLGEFQQLHRIPSHYADAAIEHQVDFARGEINAQLVDKKAGWVADGHNALTEVDDADGGNRHRDYLAAVYYRAKANLLADFQTMSRRESAEDIAKESDAMYQRLMATSHKALRRLLGLKTSIDVELL